MVELRQIGVPAYASRTRRPVRHWPKGGRIYRRRRIRTFVAVAIAAVGVWLAISLGGALTNPTFGSSLSARLAEWAREHGAGGMVTWAENEWYSHHPPRVGGAPPKGSIRHPSSTTVALTVGPPHLPPPSALQPFASPAIAGEGQWSPIGRKVGGVPAVYETTLRPDAVHTSYVVGVAWMDTKLLRATLYSGSQIPGGGPYAHTAPVQPVAARTLVAAFNAGFLMADANGGDYTDGKVVVPLRSGVASFVVYGDGTSTVGKWGRDVTMTPDVVSVRQNLDLLVDNGQPAPGLNASDYNRLGQYARAARSTSGVQVSGSPPTAPSSMSPAPTSILPTWPTCW